MLDINKIYHGDGLEVMKSIDDKSVDMILCDLPYGTTSFKWDEIIPFPQLWNQYKRIIKDNGAIVLTASQPFTSVLISSNLQMFKYEWIWVKTKKTGFTIGKNRPLSQHENICVFSKANVANGSKLMMKYNPQGLLPFNKIVKGNKNSNGDLEWQHYGRPSQLNDYLQEFTNYPTTVLNVASEGKTIHPTQKPVQLFEYLIKTYSDENDLVLDNCLGSGTTAIAAINTKRNFIGIEKDKKYFDLSEERIKNHLKTYL